MASSFARARDHGGQCCTLRDGFDYDGDETTHIVEFISTGGAKTVLDAGCYRGGYGLYLKDHNVTPVTVVGADLDADALQTARHNLDHVVRADLAALPFRSDSFELAICVETIEHLDRDAGKLALRSMLLCARRLVVTTPNGFIESKCHLVETKPLMRHRTGYSAAELRSLGANKVRGAGYWSRVPGPLARLLGGLTYYLPGLAPTLVATFERL